MAYRSNVVTIFIPEPIDQTRAYPRSTAVLVSLIVFPAAQAPVPGITLHDCGCGRGVD